MHRMFLAIVLGLVCSLILLVSARPSVAEQLPMTQRAGLFGDRGPMFAVQPKSDGQDRRSASLFAGQSNGSLLAPYPARSKPARRVASFAVAPPLAGPGARIRHLIALAEAGKHGYDAVQHAAKRKPRKRPTEMTIQEIYTWIANTPGQQHAIGRYQFIPATLKRLVNDSGINPNSVFSERVQDQLADVLLDEAGLAKMMRGEMTRRKFMHNLAKIWAGLPTSSGKSYYRGIAGNRATMSWAHFDAEMKRIFPG